jgi:hypothetical protein
LFNLKIYEGGKVKSSEGQKVFVVENDDKYKILKSGSTFKMRIEFEFVNNSGAHLIKAVFHGKDVDLGIH